MDRQGIIERVKIVLDEYTPVDGSVLHPLDGYFNPLLDESAKELILKAPISKLYPVYVKDTKVSTIISEVITGTDTELSTDIKITPGIHGVAGTEIVRVGDEGQEGAVTISKITEFVDKNLILLGSQPGCEGVVEVSTLEYPRIVSVKVSDWVREVAVFEPIGSHREVLQANKYTRGTRSRPVVSISKDGDNHVLRCYTTKEENPTVKISAIKTQKAEELHEDLIAPLVLLTAAKVAQATERPDVFKTLYELYVKSLS